MGRELRPSSEGTAIRRCPVGGAAGTAWSPALQLRRDAARTFTATQPVPESHQSGSWSARELRSGCRLGFQPDFAGRGPSSGGWKPQATETARMAILQRRLGAPAISGLANFRSDSPEPVAPHSYRGVLERGA